jgi:hypothetical protein
MEEEGKSPRRGAGELRKPDGSEGAESVTGWSSTVVGPHSTVAGVYSTVAVGYSTVAGGYSIIAGPCSSVAGLYSTIACRHSMVTAYRSSVAGPRSLMEGGHSRNDDAHARGYMGMAPKWDWESLDEAEPYGVDLLELGRGVSEYGPDVCLCERGHGDDGAIAHVKGIVARDAGIVEGHEGLSYPEIGVLEVVAEGIESCRGKVGLVGGVGGHGGDHGDELAEVLEAHIKGEL